MQINGQLQTAQRISQADLPEFTKSETKFEFETMNLDNEIQVTSDSDSGLPVNWQSNQPESKQANNAGNNENGGNSIMQQLQNMLMQLLQQMKS